MRTGIAAAGFWVTLLSAIAFCYLPGLPAPRYHDDSLVSALCEARSSGDACGRGLLERFRDPVPPSPQAAIAPRYAWRPLTEATLIWNARLARGFAALRVGNLLLHAAAAAVVFVLAGRLAGAAAAPWAALLFAVHPLAVQAVTYVYQRAASLEALLAFLCLAFYLSRRAGPALAAGLLAAAAKETAATLPLMLLAIEWVLRDPAEPRDQVLRRLAPFLLVPALVGLQVGRAISAHAAARAGAEGAVRESADGAFTDSLLHASPAGLTPAGYLLRELPVVARYGTLAAAPFPLGFYRDRATALPGQDPGTGPETLLCGALLAGAIAFASAGPRTLAVPRLAVALFLAPLALESSVLPIRDLAFLHRCYPSLLGAALLFGWAAAKTRPALPLACLTLMAGLCLHENRVWADDAACLRRDVRNAWHNPLAWGNLGAIRLDDDRPDRALPLLARAIRSPWRDVNVAKDWVRALAALGRAREAHGVLREGLARLPRSPVLVWAAVIASESEGDAEALARLAERARDLRGQLPELDRWLALRERRACP